MKPIISIVIPTRNRAEKLKKTLMSVYSQEADENKWEVIVINNGSVDETTQICESYKNRYVNFRYYYDATPGLHVGRNKGLIESNGSIVAYLDDDVILFSSWIDEVLKTFEEEKVMAACGSVIPYDFSVIPQSLMDYRERINGFEVLLPISCFWTRKLIESEGIVKNIDPNMIFGANAIYRKKVLLECKGFHPDGMPKELLKFRGDGETYVANWLRIHRAKVVYNSKMSVYHMIDVERVNDQYIAYMFFRNGISSMYSKLRFAGSMHDSILSGIRKLIEDAFFSETNKRYLLGELYLLFQFCLSNKVREWINKETYME